MRKHYECQDLPRYYRVDHYYDYAETFFTGVPKDEKVLNVGCGRGESLRDFPLGVGIDFNSKLLPLWESLGVADRCITRSATSLPWADDEFAWSISVDFLEHVQPDDVAPVVKELLRIAPCGKHIVDLRCQSHYRGPDGENLHPSALDARQWTVLIGNQLNASGASRSMSVSQEREHLFVVWGP